MDKITKIELSQNNRIKRHENYAQLDAIESVIRERIRSEYTEEIKQLRNENDKSFEEEKEFILSVKQFLPGLSPSDKLKVTTQVGRNSDIIRTYTGHIEKRIPFNQSYFNFVSPDYIDGKPFTIGLSCLQSIEILTEE